MPSIITNSSEWKTLNATGPSDQVFAIGDIHGKADVLLSVLNSIKNIERTAATRRLIFTGDIIDRGPASLLCIQYVMNAHQIANVDEVVILPGNHELMLLDALETSGFYFSHWYENGGKSVVREIIGNNPLPKTVSLIRMIRASIDIRFLNMIFLGPTFHFENDLLFVHAGILPQTDLSTYLSQSRFFVLDPDHWAWIRDPFLEWEKGWNGLIVIHGHTPALIGQDGFDIYELEADHVKNYQRLCLDAGAAYFPQIGWAEFVYNEYRIFLTELVQ